MIRGAEWVRPPGLLSVADRFLTTLGVQVLSSASSVPLWGRSMSPVDMVPDQVPFTVCVCGLPGGPPRRGTRRGSESGTARPGWPMPLSIWPSTLFANASCVNRQTRAGVPRVPRPMTRPSGHRRPSAVVSQLGFRKSQRSTSAPRSQVSVRDPVLSFHRPQPRWVPTMDSNPQARVLGYLESQTNGFACEELSSPGRLPASISPHTSRHPAIPPSITHHPQKRGGTNPRIPPPFPSQDHGKPGNRHFPGAAYSPPQTIDTTLPYSRTDRKRNLSTPPRGYAPQRPGEGGGARGAHARISHVAPPPSHRPPLRLRDSRGPAGFPDRARGGAYAVTSVGARAAVIGRRWDAAVAVTHPLRSLRAFAV